MKSVKSLEVYYHGRLAGNLAKIDRNRIAFSYAEGWLKEGFSISPFSLPLKEGVFVAEKPYFNGLFGTFADSLPDSWGRLLMDRRLRELGIDEGQVGVLDRLAMIGDTGKGALTYMPRILENNDAYDLSDLDQIAEDTRKLIQTQDVENLDRLYFAGASSGGTRPKINATVDGKEWIIKFPSPQDPPDIGLAEKCYSDCASSCGILVPGTRLFPSKKCAGYFGTERFDRGEGGRRIHMLTVAALLELDFTEPSLDYNSLMKLCKIMTRDDNEEQMRMFRLMCFNVFAHNRDDHSKNFTYLYDEEKDQWHLSPAYDLTYSNTYFGEQTTSVNGEGKNPGMKDVLAVGKNAGLPQKFCQKTAEEIKEKADELVKKASSQSATTSRMRNSTFSSLLP